MQNFVVIRISVQDNGRIAAPVNAYETKPEAERQYFTLCAQAVMSSYQYDSIVLMTKDGFLLKRETFAHELPEPEGEPELEPEPTE